MSDERQPYPLGVPKRVIEEAERAQKAFEKKAADAHQYRFINNPLPDGTVVPVERKGDKGAPGLPVSGGQPMFAADGVAGVKLAYAGEELARIDAQGTLHVEALVKKLAKLEHDVAGLWNKQYEVHSRLQAMGRRCAELEDRLEKVERALQRIEDRQHLQDKAAAVAKYEAIQREGSHIADKLQGNARYADMHAHALQQAAFNAMCGALLAPKKP